MRIPSKLTVNQRECAFWSVKYTKRNLKNLETIFFLQSMIKPTRKLKNMFLTLNAHDFTSPPTLFTPSDLPVFYVMENSLNR